MTRHKNWLPLSHSCMQCTRTVGIFFWVFDACAFSLVCFLKTKQKKERQHTHTHTTLISAQIILLRHLRQENCDKIEERFIYPSMCNFQCVLLSVESTTLTKWFVKTRLCEQQRPTSEERKKYGHRHKLRRVFIKKFMRTFFICFSFLIHWLTSFCWMESRKRIEYY